ncbi:MAG TPA: hypothetical protein V6D33_09760 [Cyanophyceae cyanobacterium]
MSSALVSPQENKNRSQWMKALLNRQSSDRKLIETHVIGSNAKPSLV